MYSRRNGVGKHATISPPPPNLEMRCTHGADRKILISLLPTDYLLGTFDLISADQPDKGSALRGFGVAPVLRGRPEDQGHWIFFYNKFEIQALVRSQV